MRGNMADWRVALLRNLGYKPTKKNLQFLSTWQRWEGGHTHNDAQFNWLNTTRDAPGAVGSINSVGVKRFDSFKSGIQATATTLKNGRYNDILDALASGDPYKTAPIAGLQTWVSGSPTGNPKYAAKVLGEKVAAQPRAPRGPRAARRPQLQQQEAKDWNWTMDFIFGDDDPEFAALMKEIPEFDDTPRSDYGPSTHAGHDHASIPRANGKTLNPGTSWRGSHVTDNLDWNRGAKTAIDIMAKPGTAVLAPESGRVIKHGSAQGGQSMYFLSDSGHLYWLGHIDGMAAVGSKVKRGQRLALISADHAAPHLHIDRYYGSDPGRYT